MGNDMKIIIIGAMEKEIDFLNAHYHAKKTEGIFPIYESLTSSNFIYLCQSGVGKVNSAMNTQYLIDQFKPDCVINTGCAGSLSKEVQIMDMVLSDTVTYHDFYPLRIMKKYTPDKGWIKSDENMLQIAKEMAKKNQIPYQVGTICSGDHFVTNDQMRDEIKVATNALCVDMESASIAHVCRQNMIPFLAIRTISDFADGVEEKEREAALRSGQVVIDCVEQLLEK